MLVQVSEEHHCYICGYVDTFITFSFILYFEIYVMTFDQRFFYSPVAPVCYAHLAAAQMSQFMKFEEFADASSGSGVPSSTATVPELPRLHTDSPLPLDPPFPLPLSARPRGEFTGGGGRDEVVPEPPDPPAPCRPPVSGDPQRLFSCRAFHTVPRTSLGDGEKSPISQICLRCCIALLGDYEPHLATGLCREIPVSLFVYYL